jgi:hypothetical protein
MGGGPLDYLPSGAEAPTDDNGDDGSFFDDGGGGAVDPCSETDARKFLRISMRSLVTDEYIHYFLVLIAYVNGDTYPNGAVCPDDVDLYVDNGYREVGEGELLEFGNYCIPGPALYYYHRSGQFRTGGDQLGSAIAPAAGATTPTYDSFFTSAGARMPVPDQILFHNPGTGEGAALQISWSATSPCDPTSADLIVDSDCDQDAFYYVDESDIMAGSRLTGAGSGRRIPGEIQGTGCQCLGSNVPYQELAPSGTAAMAASCNEFLRGGLIEYVFVREDENPPYPQLLWRVTDQSGSEVHDFDQRGPLP